MMMMMMKMKMKMRDDEKKSERKDAPLTLSRASNL